MYLRKAVEFIGHNVIRSTLKINFVQTNIGMLSLRTSKNYRLYMKCNVRDYVKKEKRFPSYTMVIFYFFLVKYKFSQVNTAYNFTFFYLLQNSNIWEKKFLFS